MDTSLGNGTRFSFSNGTNSSFYIRASFYSLVSVGLLILLVVALVFIWLVICHTDCCDKNQQNDNDLETGTSKTSWKVHRPATPIYDAPINRVIMGVNSLRMGRSARVYPPPPLPTSLPPALPKRNTGFREIIYSLPLIPVQSTSESEHVYAEPFESPLEQFKKIEPFEPISGPSKKVFSESPSLEPFKKVRFSEPLPHFSNGQKRDFSRRKTLRKVRKPKYLETAL